MWKPRFRDSSCVRHSRSTEPSGWDKAWKEEMSTAVGDWMLLTEVEELLVRLGSEVVELTVAVLLDRELALNVVALTLMVMMAVLPTLKLPRSHVTVPAAKTQEPWLVNAEVNVTSPGSGSVTVTPCATAGPPFVTWRV